MEKVYYTRLSKTAQSWNSWNRQGKIVRWTPMCMMITGFNDCGNQGPAELALEKRLVNANMYDDYWVQWLGKSRTCRSSKGKTSMGHQSLIICNIYEQNMLSHIYISSPFSSSRHLCKTVWFIIWFICIF